MKVVCISDLHGTLPEIPKCDLLLIAGDVCPHHPSPNVRVGTTEDTDFQASWLDGPFRWWLHDIPAKKVVACWGNHDFIGEVSPWKAPLLRWWMLTDSATDVDGLKVWGTPWSPWFYDWAFNAPKWHGDEFLRNKFSSIPPRTDIIVAHGPPLDHGDRTSAGRSAGSSAMLDTIERVKPRLVVTGHIHEAYGQYRIEDTLVVNASILDQRYKHVNKPVEIEL